MTKTLKEEETFVLNCEYTDTLPCSLSDRAVVRRAKAALGLAGMRGRMDNSSDSWTFHPYGHCTVAFFQTRY